MDTKEINHIAKLARLKFYESGVDSIAKDLNDILKWMDILLYIFCQSNIT